MEQRKEFLEAAVRGEHSFTELCRRYGISRKNGYKWLRRYRDQLAFPSQDMSFADRSRRPHRSPTAISDEVEAAIVEFRRLRPHWGPRKLRVVLGKQTRARAAVGEHVRGGLEASRHGETAAQAGEEHAVHDAPGRGIEAECAVGDRLQG